MSPLVKLAMAIGVGAIFLGSRKAGASVAVLPTKFASSGITLMGQGDPKWAKVLVGFSTREMEDIGCVLTALVMAINALTGQQLTPPVVNDFAKAMGNKGAKLPGFDGALIFSSNVASLLGCKKLDGIVDGRNVPAIKALIDDTLIKGGLALVRVDYDLGTPSSNHTLVCYKKVAAGYECADPAGAGKIITLNNNLFIQRTTTKTKTHPNGLRYFGVGCAPMFRAVLGAV